MTSWLKKYRHSRGFGVHSPFAFRFITEALNDADAHYYDDYMLEDGERAVMRTAVFLQPRELCVMGNATDKAARLGCDNSQACAPIWTGVETVRMLIAGDGAAPAEVAKRIREGWVAFIDAQDCVAPAIKALNTLGFGMSFDNEHGRCIAVPFRHLPRQDFKINF